jgi:hypothetical protein
LLDNENDGVDGLINGDPPRPREHIPSGLAGDQPASKITSASLEKGRDRRTASQGRHFLDAMRGLFRWAAKAKLVARDPTIGVENPTRRFTRAQPIGAALRRRPRT